MFWKYVVVGGFDRSYDNRSRIYGVYLYSWSIYTSVCKSPQWTTRWEILRSGWIKRRERNYSESNPTCKKSYRGSLCMRNNKVTQSISATHLFSSRYLTRVPSKTGTGTSHSSFLITHDLRWRVSQKYFTCTPRGDSSVTPPMSRYWWPMSLDTGESPDSPPNKKSVR